MLISGVVRRFDDLGRIVIPKEIRAKLFGTKGNMPLSEFIAWMMCIAMRTISELKFRRKRLSRLLKSLLRIMTVMLRKMTCFGN